MKFSKTYTTLGITFVMCVIVSNILASKMILVGSWTLPAAVIIFPISYILNDAISEVYGFTKAKYIILMGFIMNLLAVVFFTIALHLPYPAFWGNQDAFAAILGNSGRVLVASFTAYIVGSTLNAKVLVSMRDKAVQGKGLFWRCILSTIIGESVDASIFITLAFVGTMPGVSLVTMIVSQATFKIVYEIIVFPLTNIVIGKLKEIENVN